MAQTKKITVTPITSGAVLEPTEAEEKLLAAYGEVYGQTVREVYKRCVIGTEPWFVKGEKALRSELIARGWSQREANSIYGTAQAAQDSAVEALKLALVSAREELLKVSKKLTKAPTERRHGLARRRARLKSRISSWEQRLKDDQVRVCFGSRRVLRATREWEKNGYATQDEAHQVWTRRRGGMIYVEGDKQCLSGNASLRLELSETGDALKLRVPPFLRHHSGGDEWVTIALQGISSKQGRGELEAAITRDPRVQARRIAEWEAKRRELPQAGSGQKEGPKISKNPPEQTCAGPVSVRLSWREDKGAWYLGASVAREASTPLPGRWKALIGVDVNPNHLA